MARSSDVRPALRHACELFIAAGAGLPGLFALLRRREGAACADNEFTRRSAVSRRGAGKPAAAESRSGCFVIGRAASGCAWRCEVALGT